MKCAIEYSDRSIYCRTGLYILQIGADLVELLAHLYNLFIFAKYHVIHGKGITLCISRFSRYVKLRLHLVSSPRMVAIKCGCRLVFRLNYILSNFPQL
jgi:hypothetical protein